MRRRLSIPVTVLALVAMHPAARAGQHPEINIHGDLYKSACSPQEWPVIREAVHQSAKNKQPEALLDLINNFLCGAGEMANARLHRSMNSKIAVISEETGTQGRMRENRSRTEFSVLAGAAWQVSVQKFKSGISVSYFPNEACAATANFRFNGKTWQFVSFGEACD